MLININVAISLTKGELIKKAIVIPNGMPAVMNPIKSGMDEQEQKGVTIPKNTARKYPYQRFLPAR